MLDIFDDAKILVGVFVVCTAGAWAVVSVIDIPS